MPDMEKLAEELGTVLAETRNLDKKMDERVALGLSNYVKREELDKAQAEAVQLANKLDEVERRFLSEQTRRIVSPELERSDAARLSRVTLGQYFKTGRLTDEGRKLMTLGMASDDASTGHYVTMPPDMATDILALLRNYSAMESVADVTTIDATEWTQTKVAAGGSAGRVAERGTRSATSTPTFGLDRIVAQGYYAYPTVTQEQLYKTTDFDLGAFIVDDGNFEIQELVEADYVSGVGVTGAKGITANATLQAAAKVTGHASTLGTTFDPLRNMTGAIHESFLPNARYMMKRSTEVALALLKDGTGKYVWTQSMTEGQPNLLFGYPVVYNAYLPAVADYATNPYCAIFGDFRQGYKVIVSRFMLLIRDEVTAPGYVKLYKEIKKGGDVRRTEAFSLLKVSA